MTPFGTIELTRPDGNSFWVRIGTIRKSTFYGAPFSPARLSTYDGFCQSSQPVKETPVQIQELIKQHDDFHIFAVKDFLQRNS